jgi:hypothetical protein
LSNFEHVVGVRFESFPRLRGIKFVKRQTVQELLHASEETESAVDELLRLWRRLIKQTTETSVEQETTEGCA